MAIDDNSWDAGYECGIRDQKKECAAKIAALTAEIESLRTRLVKRDVVRSDLA